MVVREIFFILKFVKVILYIFKVVFSVIFLNLGIWYFVICVDIFLKVKNKFSFD